MIAEKLKSKPKDTWNFYGFVDFPSIRGVNRIGMLLPTKPPLESGIGLRHMDLLQKSGMPLRRRPAGASIQWQLLVKPETLYMEPEFGTIC